MPKKYNDGVSCSLQGWCISQIKKKEQKKLTRQQITKLDKAGFVWVIKDLDATWEKRYQEFVEFKKNNPTVSPPTRINGIASPLYSWYMQQRDFKYKLSPERISKLNAVGMNWKNFNNDKAWEQHFAAFVEFKKNNSEKMPTYDKIDKAKKPLYHWCFIQRRNKINGLLSEIKTKRLEAVGFIWGYFDFDEAWENHYKDYVAFIKENPGKKLVESGSKQEGIISRWCSRQRSRKIKLSPEQIKKLDDLEFVWEILVGKQDLTWEKWFQQYRSFLKNNPTGIPPYKINGKTNFLNVWYVKQCQGKKLLSENQINRLNEVGFVWQIKNKIEKWDSMFCKFVEYKESKDAGKPTFLTPAQPKKIQDWCSTQRTNKTKLTAEQIKKLNDAGFSWQEKTMIKTGKIFICNILRLGQTKQRACQMLFCMAKQIRCTPGAAECKNLKINSRPKKFKN
ncbi:MAG: helicase associated domain-containing protein [Bacteroidota bacterium]